MPEPPRVSRTDLLRWAPFLADLGVAAALPGLLTDLARASEVGEGKETVWDKMGLSLSPAESMVLALLRPCSLSALVCYCFCFCVAVALWWKINTVFFLLSSFSFPSWLLYNLLFLALTLLCSAPPSELPPSGHCSIYELNGLETLKEVGLGRGQHNHSMFPEHGLDDADDWPIVPLAVRGLGQDSSCILSTPHRDDESSRRPLQRPRVQQHLSVVCACVAIKAVKAANFVSS